MNPRTANIGFFITDFILLIVFLGLISIIFRFDGLPFLLELIFGIILLFAAFIALIPAYSGSRFSWAVLAGVFSLVLLDLLSIHLKTALISTVFLLTLLFAAIGFIVSVWCILDIKEKEKIKKPLKEPIKKEEVKQEKKEVHIHFDPGKYVASKKRTVYHLPKCDWVRRIKRENRVWFQSTQEAKRKGYQPHEDCSTK